MGTLGINRQGGPGEWERKMNDSGGYGGLRESRGPRSKAARLEPHLASRLSLAPAFAFAQNPPLGCSSALPPLACAPRSIAVCVRVLEYK